MLSTTVSGVQVMLFTSVNTTWYVINCKIHPNKSARGTILIHGNLTTKVTPLGKLNVDQKIVWKASSCCLDNTNELKSISHAAPTDAK